MVNSKSRLLLSAQLSHENLSKIIGGFVIIQSSLNITPCSVVTGMEFDLRQYFSSANQTECRESTEAICVRPAWA
tara:strand:- start:19 stop:243 length:225 start_codon:yes stop_codon:yes gene_type:complete